MSGITECCICYENINNEDLHQTICNHIFHNKCISLWKERNNTCPICREKISPDIINNSTENNNFGLFLAAVDYGVIEFQGGPNGIPIFNSTVMNAILQHY